MAESVEPPNASSDPSPTPPEPAPSEGTGPGEGTDPEPESGPASSPSTLMDAEIEQEVAAAMEGMSTEEMQALTGDPAKTGDGKGSDGSKSSDGSDILTGRVVRVAGDDIFVDVGARAEGICPRAHFDEPPDVGSTVEVIILRTDPETGCPILSRKGAPVPATWDTLNRGAVVEGRVIGMHKGGLEINLNGIRAFMPASQCDLHRMHDISILLGETIRCIVMEVNPRQENVLVSRRRLLEHEAVAKRETLMTELAEGQTRTGVVGNVTDFGAFVDLGGIDGLVHVSNLSHARVEKPSDVVKPGQTVEVKVLKINRDTGKISLGLKQAQPDPWAKAAEKYAPGQHVQGTVLRMADFGAFVELEPGLDALVPVSELSWSRRPRHPSEVLQTGQVLTAAILKVDADHRKISVSLRQTQADPWTGVEDEFPAGSVLSGTVTRTTDFGAFVELRTGVEGLVHISELSTAHVRQTTDAVKSGDEIKVKVLGVDTNARRISLSIKQAAEGYADYTPPAEESKPKKKRKKPLRGGLSTDDGWFLG